MARSSSFPAMLKVDVDRIKNRRSSVIHELGPEEDVPLVHDAWDMSCVQQLIQYTNDHPNDFWDWLKTITADREQYARAVETMQEMHNDLASKYDNLTNKHKDLEGELDASEDQVTAAQQQVSKYREQVMKLKDALNEKNDELLTRLDSSSNSQSGLHTPKHEKSHKIPNPPIFTDGKDPIWDDWSAKMREKLDGNADYFPTAKDQVNYVLTRLGGEAATYTLHRREKGTNNPYLTAEEILEELAETYEDCDRLENARRSLTRLTMGDRPFRYFIADFMRLGRATRFDDNHLMQLLREKLPQRLLMPMLSAGALVKFESLKGLKDYLLKLDNSHQQDLPLLKRKTSRGSTRKGAYDTTQNRVSETPSTPRRTTIKTPICYQCGENGHIKPKCTVAQQTPKGLKAEKEANIHEVHIAEISDNEVDDSGSLSESSSYSGKD